MHTFLHLFFERALNAVHQDEETAHQFLGNGCVTWLGALIAHVDLASGGVVAALVLQKDGLGEPVERGICL
jgi:hypothetical protein